MAIGLKTHSAVGMQAGFTLFELLIVVGIAAILAAIGLPAMRQFVQNYQASNAASGLVTSLNYARSEAIKEDQPSAGGAGVQICASSGAVACDTTNWATGWIVLSPAGAAPLQIIGALPSTMTLTVTPANAAVVFLPNGTAPALAVGANQRAMFKLCDSRGARAARDVEVSIGGIIQASSVLGHDVSGAALTCP